MRHDRGQDPAQEEPVSDSWGEWPATMEAGMITKAGLRSGWDEQWHDYRGWHDDKGWDEKWHDGKGWDEKWHDYEGWDEEKWHDYGGWGCMEGARGFECTAPSSS